MAYKKVVALDWSSELGSLGSIVEGLADIQQCISIILSTPKGSVPHRPTFGCDLWRYIDMPVSVAKPQIVREATQAIQLWESRATLRSISLENSAIGHYKLVVSWTPSAQYDAENIVKQEVLL